MNYSAPPARKKDLVVIKADDLDRFCKELARASAGSCQLTPLEGDAEVLSRAVQASLEKLEADCGAMRSFVSDAAHQLRTPLAVLTAKLTTPGVEVRHDMLRDDLLWMGRLIDQLLSASRVAIAPDPGEEEFVLGDLCHELVSALLPLAVFRGRDLSLDETISKVTVRGSRDLAFEAMSNLVENALAHAPLGSLVQVVVDAPARVHVINEGEPIDDLDKERIFERFSQG
ncbi:MAG: HAMP domain-containing sensor histidine kinase, partial [Pseudomonadota bacterium]